uniref:Uncharacterized protein n=1 Tax=Florenciella sp. virus SA2 TaxID=3240092 RepID=A0AB39JBR3_9VIRU
MTNAIEKKFTNKLQNTQNSLKTALKQSTNVVTNVAKKTTNTIKSEVTKQANSIKAASNKSESVQSGKAKMAKLGSDIKDFAEKNSTITKVIFILFVFILFGILIRLGVYIISLFLTTDKNPIVADGTLNTNLLTLYQVNPSLKNSKPILKSINENQGMEYTWSSWIFIDNAITGSETTPKRFFSKGQTINKNINSNENSNINVNYNFLMNSPGLYLWDNSKKSSYENTISIVVSKYNADYGDEVENDLTEIIEIKNIPIQKWVNVIIRIQNRTIDVYINGVLSVRRNLNYVIKQNFGDIYVGDNKSGPSGYLSSLRYFSYAIGNHKIQDIIKQGPNLKLIDNNCSKYKDPKYLSSRWYTDGYLY